MQCPLCEASCAAELIGAIKLDRCAGCHALCPTCHGVLMTASAWEDLVGAAERQLLERQQRLGPLDGMQLIVEILGAGLG
jgi:hypothetical protein